MRESSGAPGPERAQIDSPLLPELDQEQRRDEVARQDEERVDPQEPALRPTVSEVVGDHRDDRDGTQAVERGSIPEGIPLHGRRSCPTMGRL
jgi:hypothetical protein